ncbi:hypothetical protein ACLOJK_018054 [Asimina triloba]
MLNIRYESINLGILTHFRYWNFVYFGFLILYKSFQANVRTYYQQFEEQQTQSLIDQRIKEHLGQTAAFQQQVGATFHQHLASFPGNPPRPRLPILPPPIMSVAGSQPPVNSPLMPGFRPPVLPRPVTGPPEGSLTTATLIDEFGGLQTLQVELRHEVDQLTMTNLCPKWVVGIGAESQIECRRNHP